MQNIIIVLLFIGALGYVANILYKSFTTSKGCASNCGKCKVDFEKPNKAIKSKK